VPKYEGEKSAHRAVYLQVQPTDARFERENICLHPLPGLLGSSGRPSLYTEFKVDVAVARCVEDRKQAFFEAIFRNKSVLQVD
jgi:hypothetical protein